LRSIADFRVTIEPLEDACVMRATGELDAATADRLRGPLVGARDDGITTLLDMSGVRFIDSSGLGVLLEAARATDRDDWAWFIVRPSPAVQRIVELSGTAPRLPLVEPQPGATRRVSPAAAARARRGRGRAALHG
jgi:stage II sporulation protein AA (anti-sigma F factor antagonist)